MNCEDIADLTPKYLSGELDRARAAAFDAHLKGCPECFYDLAQQARAEAAWHETALLEHSVIPAVDWSRVEQLVPEPAPPVAIQPVVRKHMPRARVIAVMSAAAALSLAVLGYLIVMGPEVAKVYANAARDHRQEIIEQHSRKWVKDPGPIAAMAERRGIPGATVLALAAQGYRLERGRLCLLGTRIFLHLVYSKDGSEFSVYLRASNGDPLPGAVLETSNGKPLHFCDENGEHVAGVESPRLMLVVVNHQSTDAALAFARFASTVL